MVAELVFNVSLFFGGTRAGFSQTGGSDSQVFGMVQVQNPTECKGRCDVSWVTCVPFSKRGKSSFEGNS